MSNVNFSAWTTIFAVDKDSREFEIRIGVGPPHETDSPYKDWACPVVMDGLHANLLDVYGIDSWQAMMLAIRLIHVLLHSFVEDGGKLYREKGRDEISVAELFGAAEQKFEPDPPLTEEQQARVKQLSADHLQAIDESVLANSSTQWRKIAYIVMKVMGTHSGEFPGVPDIFYAERVRNLVSAGKLESQGNLTGMRFSEVRLPQSSIKPTD